MIRRRKISGAVPYKNREDMKRWKRKLRQEYGEDIQFDKGHRVLSYEISVPVDSMFVREY